MCLAIPMVLVERNEFGGVAEIDGVRRDISVIYVPDAQVGDDDVGVHRQPGVRSAEPLGPDTGAVGERPEPSPARPLAPGDLWDASRRRATDSSTP